MQYTLDKYHLQAEVNTQECHIPDDLKPTLQEELDRIGEAVADFAESQLWLTIVHHPNSDVFHAQAKLKLPGQTIITGGRDADLGIAIQRCVSHVLRRVHAYRISPDEGAVLDAATRKELADNIIAPVEVDDGPLGDAVVRDDYPAFRRALLGSEERIRMRVGRWVQRYPKVQSQIGQTIEIADIVEEVFIIAFECYAQRPSNVPLGDWLEDQVDPAVKAFAEHPIEEAEASRRVQSTTDLPR